MPRRPSGPPLLPLRAFPNPEQPLLQRLPQRPLNFPESAPFPGSKSILQGWSVRRHVFPGAFPRSRKRSVLLKSETSYVPVVNTLPKDPNSHKYTDEEIYEICRNLADASKNAERTDVNNPEYQNERPLWISVNRYTPPTISPDGLTLVLCHANGFHKETWEPAISDLLSRNDCPSIADIWSLDTIHHGDSALLNESSLGPIFTWEDNARDIVNFLLHYIPPISSQNVPTVLADQELNNTALDELNEKESVNEAMTNPDRSWRGRKIVGIGNSLGGSCLVSAAGALPQLFASLVLLDPVITAPEQDLKSPDKIGPGSFLGGSIKRRDNWPSFDSAREAFMKNKGFFGKWREDVFERYCNFGLIKKDPNGQGEGVVLKTPKRYEQATFAAGIYSGLTAYDRLASIPESLPVHTVIPTFGASSPRWAAMQRTQQLPHLGISFIEEGGHLSPLERPDIVAHELTKLLSPLTSSTTPGTFNMKAKN